MAIKLKFSNFFKNLNNSSYFSKYNKFRITNKYQLILLFSAVFFTIVFFTTKNIVEKRSLNNESELRKVTNSGEFSNLTSYIISKIRSPYQEVKYTIENNDSIEKILKKYEVRNVDIKDISTQLKQKNLSNIYSGRELSLIIKKLDDGSKTVVNLLYPISNTISIEVRKIDKTFKVNENILRLYKK